MNYKYKKEKKGKKYRNIVDNKKKSYSKCIFHTNINVTLMQHRFYIGEIKGNDARKYDTLSLIFHIKCSLTFPHVKDIPLGLRSLKTSVTCLFRMEEELPPHACSNLSPAPNILISLSIIAPNGKSRKRNEIDTGANSRLSGVFILLFFAIYNFFKF